MGVEDVVMTAGIRTVQRVVKRPFPDRVALSVKEAFPAA
jgi:hypothetical protein